MTRSKLSSATLAALLCASVAHAAVPDYPVIELQARSNLIVNDNGWNVPPGTSFNSITAAINDDEQVAFTAGVVPIGGDLLRTGAGLWLGGHGAGGFVAIHETGSSDPEATMIISDRPSINAGGDVAYYTSVDGGTYTLRRYDAVAGASAPVSMLPLTPSSLANPDITDAGTIGFKGRMGFGYGIAAVIGGTGTLYAVDTDVDAGSPYAYIFSPATDASGRIAVKVSTSDYDHNEIRLFDAGGGSERVVADVASDPASPFATFDNGLGLSDGGTVAVVVKLADGNARAVYRFTPVAGGYEATEIARVDAAGTIRAIDSFAPDVNDDGLVVFRASDVDGQAVYAGDGTSLVRIAGNGDVVATDQGAGQLGQHDASPVFSGAPTVNDQGDVAFVAGLHPQGDNQVEWGSGVFVAYADGAAPDDTVFADGFELPAGQ